MWITFNRKSACSSRRWWEFLLSNLILFLQHRPTILRIHIFMSWLQKKVWLWIPVRVRQNFSQLWSRCPQALPPHQVVRPGLPASLPSLQTRFACSRLPRSSWHV